MLKELSIKNFAIIDDIRIEFTKGLNLLTGETGSGKSIIIDALGVVLGGRSSKDLIRTGEDKAFIEALFFVDKHLQKIIRDIGFDINEETLIISKEISINYPSVSRINGRPVTLNMLSSITDKLVDIFGQHEHQSLLNVSNHQILIDSLGDERLKSLLKEYESLYALYKEDESKLSEMNISAQEREREIDLLKFQIDEIDEADLKEEDDEQIELEYKKLSNVMSITSGVGEVLSILNEDSYESSSVIGLLDKSISGFSSISRYDDGLNSYQKRLEDIRYEIMDINRELNYYLENMELDDERLGFLEDRLDLTNRLKRKYGITVEKILKYKEEITDRYESLINFEMEKKSIEDRIEEYKHQLISYGTDISEERKKIAYKLEQNLAEELSELNMRQVIFKVNFTPKETISSKGMDNIEFLISTNPGEELRSLSRIVSGGEMSRIMLAFKSIMAEKDNMDTLIFDEIDTGISGRTAQIMGEKIRRISKLRQVISISHLPQIAALADSHFVISKDISASKAITRVEMLSEDERVFELARLLGGVDVTDLTLQHAREMLNLSKKI